jgi:hypothetical protein
MPASFPATAPCRAQEDHGDQSSDDVRPSRAGQADQSGSGENPTFDATSLREHSNMLNMFTFPQRKRQSSARQIVRNQRGAANPSIRPDARGTPFAILSAISK